MINSRLPILMNFEALFTFILRYIENFEKYLKQKL